MDEHGRILPGWGFSWWLHERRLCRGAFAKLKAEHEFDRSFRYFDEQAAGWSPNVPESEWVGPPDPFEGPN